MVELLATTSERFVSTLRSIPRQLKQRIGVTYRRWRNLRATVGVDAREAWTGALDEEMAFWRAWFNTKGGEWPDDYKFRLNPESVIQDQITRYLGSVTSTSVRMLDVGAGPLTYVGKLWPGHELSLTAVDALADKYDGLLAEAKIIPPIRTMRCESERLTEMFGSNSFDIVYALNTLDHSYHPMDAIKQMVAVARPGGIVLLQHYLNEAEKEEYEGLHQWNFDMVDEECLLWRPNKKWLLSNEVASDARVTGYKTADSLTVVMTKHETAHS